MLKFRWYITVAVLLGSFGKYCSVESLEYIFNVAKQHLSYLTLRSLLGEGKQSPISNTGQNVMELFILQPNRTRKTLSK